MDGLREQPGDETPIRMFEEAVAELGDRPLLHSFTTPIGARQIDALVDGLAAGMQSLGVAAGDRVGLYLQNDPQYVVAMLAVWRLGAIAVACNPMLRERELAHHLDDSGATALVVLDELYETARKALDATPAVSLVLSTGRDDLGAGELAHGEAPEGARDLLELAQGEAPEGARDLLGLARAHAGVAYDRVDPAPGDTAVLTYTSGTTGPAKGAMNTHGNIAFASRVYRDLLGVGDRDTILGIAPLYHVTGLTGHIGLALAARAPLILAHRFDAARTGELVEYHRATVTIAAITAYMALANDEQARRRDYSSMRRAYSGGAPIPPAVVEDLRLRLGITIRPVYGLTETTGPTHLVPPELEPPVDPATGALSVGRTVPGTSARIAPDPTADGGERVSGTSARIAPDPAADGRERVPGTSARIAPDPTADGGDPTADGGEPAVGEVLIAGPQVVPGYWRRPEVTATAIPAGELHTGDVGVIDDDGWLYLVDRSKDMIIASGFKVWPREVEDVLYEHAAVREAAVVGVPDDYRGETVWAYVSLKAGAQVQPPELIAHCRARLAAYKYPREVRILDELPKTPTGKILRRELRPLDPAR